MSLQGIAESKHKLRGSVAMPDMIVGKSAYEIALMNGFEGTEQEWLASLKGDKGDKGDRGTTGKKGDKGDPGIGLPAVTSADNGKNATVMGGAWVAFDGTYLDLTFEGELYNGRYEYNFYHVGNGIELTLGEKYKVIYDGVEYECECKGAEDYKYLGNASMATDLVNDAEDTGEPFFVWLRTYIVMTATGGEHTIKICVVEEKSWNDLTDKPFYEETVSLGDKITWDGTPSDTVISLGEVSEGVALELHHVSDATPLMSDLIGATIFLAEGLDYSSIELIAENLQALNSNVYGVVVDTTILAAVCLVDDYSVSLEGMNIYIPKKGIYFLSVGGEPLVKALQKEGYTFTATKVHKLDPKFLAFSKTEVLADEIVNVTAVDFASGVFSKAFAINEGQTYVVEIDGTRYSCVGEVYTEGDVSTTYLGDTGVFGGSNDKYPFLILNGGDTIIFMPASGGGDYAVKVYTTECAKIPEECLPDAYPVVTLTTPIENGSFTDEENAALTAAYNTGKPVVVKGTLTGTSFTTVAATGSADGTIGLSWTYGGINILLYFYENAWAVNISLLDQTDKISALEQRVFSNEQYIADLQNMALNPDNDGAFLMVKDNTWQAVHLQDVSEEGM